MLVFEEKIPAGIRNEFVTKVVDISERLKINPNWLMGVMNSETGGTFSPSELNRAGSGAVGLIQFMPDTARGLGTSTEALRSMDAVQQLDYVYKYYKPYKNHITKYEDLYLVAFYPNADRKFAGTLYKPDDWAFPDFVYSMNKGIDVNKDGKITISDFRQWVMAKIPPDRIMEFKQAIATAEKFVKRNFFFIAVGALTVSLGTYFILTNINTKK